MDYKNTEIKLDTLATYFNEERISLIPVSSSAGKCGSFLCGKS
jgi:hypothetical protein